MTRLKGNGGGNRWLWIILLIVLIVLVILALDYFNVWNLGLI
ncbi:hypothetical protein [Deinococcus sp.]